MTTPTKVILLVWGVIACLVVALILFTLPSGHSGEESNLQSALIGKWTGDGGETDDFLRDGTVVITAGTKTSKYRFTVLDEHRLQLLPENGSFSHDVVFTDVTVKDDRMTVKSPLTGGEATYRRLKSSDASPTVVAKESATTSATPPTASPAAPQSSVAAQVAKRSENLKADLVGKWQIPGKNEIHQWSADGTVHMTAPGHDIQGRYIVMGGDRIKVFADGQSPMTAPMWCAEIYGDTLVFTSATENGPVVDVLARVKPDGSLGTVALPPHGRMDQSIAGSWTSGSSGESLVLLPDHTFKFGENGGQWQIVGDELIATDPNSHTTWKMYLLPDGHTLSGHFGIYTDRLRAAGAITLNR